MTSNFQQLTSALQQMERYVAQADKGARAEIDRRLHEFSRYALDTVMHVEPLRCAAAVHEALNASNRELGVMLAQKLAGLDLSKILAVLWDGAKEVALYIGGGAVLGGTVGGALGSLAAGAGAVPGALAGAALGIEIGSAIMTVMGLASLVEGLVNVFPLMCQKITQGFACAWRAGQLPDNARASYRPLIKQASTLFAEGKVLLLISILSAVSLLLAKKTIRQDLFLGELGKSKLGQGFADWVAQNREKLIKHPALARKSAAAEGRAATAAERKAAQPEKAAAPERTPSNRKEGEANQACPACVLVGQPVNPVSGCKILAGASELDFALPAPLALVWQRVYSSGQRQVGLLGQGWSTPLSLALEVRGDEVEVLDAFAREITFSLPRVGESVYSPSEKITLSRTGERAFELSGVDGSRDLFAVADNGYGVARLVGQIDANGNRLSIGYNVRQLPELVEDGAGRAFTFDYLDVRGQPRLRSISVQHGAPDAGPPELLVAYAYDDAGNLSQVSNGAGEVTRQFAYRQQIMVEHRQPGGLVSRYEYDDDTASGKVTRNWTNTGLSWELRYLAHETIVTDNLGREQRYRFDAKRRFTGQVDAAGGVITRELDSDGNVLAVTDAGGRSTRYRYDGRSRVIRIESAGQGTGIVYDARFDKPALITDAMGATTVLRYDENGNLTSVTDALGQRTAYHYDQFGLPVRVTDAKGGVKRLAYNRAAQLISYTDCSEYSTYFSYDLHGRLTRATDAAGNVTQYQYDAVGRLHSVLQPDGATMQYEYDALGRLRASIDASGNRTTYELDVDGRPRKRIDARGGVLEYRYDAARRVAELINENGDAHRFVYDVLDRLSEETGFDARLTRYRYDASGLVAGKEELGSGERTAQTRIDTHYVRDSAGQLVEKLISRTTGDTQAEQLRLRFAYDPVGRMTQASNADADVTLQYDALGQLIAEQTISDGQSTALRHAYDALGNRTETVLPDGRVLNNLYYGSGHLHQINIDGDVVTDIERDRLHRAVQRTQGALTSQFQYDPVGRLLAQVAGHLGVGQGAEPVIARRYEYDESGNLLAIDDQRNGRKQYSYDVVGRIMSAVQPDLAERFAFDPAHNLLDASVASGGRVEGNRVRVFEDKRYDYDAHGNLTEKRIGKHTRLQLVWNAAHQLVKSVVTRHAQAPEPTVQAVKYVYDPFGRRIAKKDAFGVTRFAWDGNRLLCEARGQWQRTYVYEPGSFVPLAQLDSVASAAGGERRCAVRHIHTDHLGTPNEVTDARGEITWASQYKAWGNVLRVVAVAPAPRDVEVVDVKATADALIDAQPIRFLGQYHDSETSLHYNRFRYYDADIGRYVSQDPIGLAGGNNSYQYAPNPSGWTDPLGLAKGPCICGGANGSVPSPLRAGQLHEAEQLAALGIEKNNAVFRPTAEQIDTGTFKAIVGEPKYTAGGQLKGTIFDGVDNGYLEIKGGSSELTSTYQLRLQTYKATIDRQPFTIQTTRSVSPQFHDYLDAWGVKVVKPIK